MKLKKLLTVLLAATLTISAFAFVGCDNGGDDSTGGGKAETYVMEAEYTNLDDVIGTGISSDERGVGMIYGQGTEEQKKMWSSGYFVGYTYTAQCKITFKFNAEAAGKARIILALGSEIGDIALNPDNFKVELNGKEVNYANMSVKNSNNIAQMAFKEYTVGTGLELVKGENTVVLSVLPNKLLQNTKDGGPCIDYLKIKTSSKLTWTDKTDNPAKRGQM